MNSKNQCYFVSVIIPVYNAEKSLDQCLKKILNQSYPLEKIEIIAVDNNSNDGTTEILNSYRRTENIRILSERKQGPSAARNAGIRISKGEILIFIDSDCLAEREYIQEHVNMHLELKDQGVSCTIIGGGIKGLNKNYWSLCDDFINWRNVSPVLPFRKELYFVPSANLSVCRRMIENEKIFFDEDLSTSEDVAFCASYIQKGYKIFFHPKAIVHHINRTSFKDFARHCTGLPKNELLLRKKGLTNSIQSDGAKSFLGKIKACILRLVNPFISMIGNIITTGRFYYLICLPFILIFLLYWYFTIFLVEIQFRQCEQGES